MPIVRHIIQKEAIDLMVQQFLAAAQNDFIWELAGDDIAQRRLGVFSVVDLLRCCDRAAHERKKPHEGALSAYGLGRLFGCEGLMARRLAISD